MLFISAHCLMFSYSSFEWFYTRGANQQIRIVDEFGQGILGVPGVETRGRHHIRRWTNPRALDDGRVNPGYEGGYFSCHGGMTPTLEVVHHPIVDVIWKVEQ